jgi:hypothetical protein
MIISLFMYGTPLGCAWCDGRSAPRMPQAGRQDAKQPEHQRVDEIGDRHQGRSRRKQKRND